MSGASDLLIIVGIGGLAYWFITKEPTTAPPTGSANITATSFLAPTIPTGTYNTVAVDITWTNTGTVTGSFVPQVSIGGSIVDLGEGTITLASGEIHHSAKTLSGVIAGNQNICPVPN
jgi:hypothetical protein